MPNWCATTYHFHGDENELKIFSECVNKWMDESFVKTGFGDSWLGNILHGVGLAERIDNPDPSIRLHCRGQIVETSGWRDNDEYYFVVVTETAWVPMPKMWSAVIEKLGLKTVGFSFEAEEPGAEIYWIYDPHNYNDFIDRVYIDAYGDRDVDNLSEYFSNEEDAVSVLNDYFDTDYENLDDFIPLCEEYNDNHDDSCICIHRFEIDNELQD